MIIKATPDNEKAKSMLNLVKNRERFIGSVSKNKFPTIVAENYYEIAKQLSAALLNLEGLKAVDENSHKETIDHLSEYKQISGQEIIVLQDLRKRRNKSQYEGKPIDSSYISNNKKILDRIIKKLKNIVEQKIE